MLIESSISKKSGVAETQVQSRLTSQDVDLAVKAMRGIADIEAGRCAPVGDVRARVLSRYTSARACV